MKQNLFKRIKSILFNTLIIPNITWKYLIRQLFVIPLVCFLSLYTTDIHGQENHLTLDYRASVDGLSSDWVNSITEDDRGFLWVGSRIGLNIYDGKEFKSLFHRPKDSTTLSGNDISFIFYSKKKKIIAGTWGNGLNIIDPISHVITKPIKDGVAEKIQVKSIVEDKDSILWIITIGSGVFKFNQESNKLVSVNYFSKKNVLDTTSFLDCEGMCIHHDTVWISSHEQGIGYIDPKTNTIIAYQHPNFNPNEIGKVSAMTSSNDKLLIGTFSAMYHELITEKGSLITSQSIIKNSTSDYRISSILYDNSGSIWITSKEGIVKKSSSSNELILYDKKEGNFDDAICSLQDSRGIIWFGNWGTGLSKHVEKHNDFVEIDPGSINGIFVNSLTEKDLSSLFINTSKGLFLFDKKSNIATNIPLTTDLKEISKLGVINILGGVKYDSTKFLIFIKHKGLYLLDSNFNISNYSQSNNELKENKSVTFVKRFNDNKVWIGTDSNGVYIHDILSNENVHFSLNEQGNKWINSNHVYSAFMDKQGNKWITTTNGVSMLAPNQDKFIPLKLRLGSQGDSTIWMKDVSSMVQDKNDHYWFSSSSGLVWYNLKQDSIRLFTEDDGVTDLQINNLIQHKDHLWGTTKNSIIYVDSDSKEVKQSPHSDGVLSSSIPGSVVVCEEDIYIGYINGLTNISSHQFSKDRTLFKIFLDKFSVNSIDQNIFSDSDPVYLDYDENNLSFLLSVIDFRKSKHNAFTHQLIGFDKQPIIHDSQEKSISYTNLNPGKYQLVIANVESENPEYVFKKVFYFTIEKPFWKKWWVIILALLLLIGIIYAIIKYRTYSIKRKNNELIQFAEQQNAEIQNRNSDLRAAYDEMAIKDKHLRSNVNYASKIQAALQPSSEEIASIFPNHFVYYKPRDVVSGDFYWSTILGPKKIFVVSDCTGHGVSGAFMSVIGITFIKSVITGMGLTRPDMILDQLHNEVSSALRQETSDIKDGMDISIICYDETTKKLEIACAYGLALIIPEEGEAKQIKSNKFPIGGTSRHYPNRKGYDLTTITIEEKTMIYLYSDGYQDQFGSENKVKFMKKRLHKMLKDNKDLSMDQQKKELDQQLNDWKQDTPQVDDIIVVGIELE